jgi:hypothetical protein
MGMKNSGREWYLKEIDEITALLAHSMLEDENPDKPLNAKYLCGYSLQRKYFEDNDMKYYKNKINNNDNEEEIKNAE